MKHLNEIELVMALDGELEPDDLQQAVEHLAECDECRDQWEKLQGLSARVAEYHSGLYAHPVAQEQKLSDKDGAWIQPGFRVPSWSWGLAAAAVVLLVV